MSLGEDGGPKISVILPVYKVERFLRKCMDSLVSQTYRNLEIILVDDGSPDRSGAICDDYAGRDSRIRVIHCANEGVSAARNKGVRAATGEYITFVDPDDWVEPTLYQELIEAAVKYGTDMTMCSHSIEKHGRSYPKSNSPETFIWDKKQIMAELAREGRLKNCVWDKLFKASVAKQIEFPTGFSLLEDVAYITAIIPHINSCVFVDKPLYHYVRHSSSALNTKNPRGLIKAHDALAGRLEFFQKHYPGGAEFHYKMMAGWSINILKALLADRTLDTVTKLAFLENLEKYAKAMRASPRVSFSRKFKLRMYMLEATARWKWLGAKSLNL